MSLASVDWCNYLYKKHKDSQNAIYMAYNVFTVYERRMALPKVMERSDEA